MATRAYLSTYKFEKDFPTRTSMRGAKYTQTIIGGRQLSLKLIHADSELILLLAHAWSWPCMHRFAPAQLTSMSQSQRHAIACSAYLSSRLKAKDTLDHVVPDEDSVARPGLKVPSTWQ